MMSQINIDVQHDAVDWMVGIHKLVMLAEYYNCVLSQLFLCYTILKDATYQQTTSLVAAQRLIT